MTNETHRVLDQPKMTFSIPDEIREMTTGDQWKTTRRGAKTLVKNDEVRVVLVVLSKGMQVDEHHAEGAAIVSVVQGSIRFKATGEYQTLATGALLTLGGGIPHALEALERVSFRGSTRTDT